MTTEIHEIRGSFLTTDAEYEYWRAGNLFTLVIKGKSSLSDDAWEGVVTSARLAFSGYGSGVIVTRVKKRTSVLEVKVTGGLRGSTTALSALEKVARPAGITWGGITTVTGTTTTTTTGFTSASITTTPRYARGGRITLRDSEG